MRSKNPTTDLRRQTTSFSSLVEVRLPPKSAEITSIPEYLEAQTEAGAYEQSPQPPAAMRRPLPSISGLLNLVIPLPLHSAILELQELCIRYIVRSGGSPRYAGIQEGDSSLGLSSFVLFDDSHRSTLALKIEELTISAVRDSVARSDAAWKNANEKKG